jgi:hypothetical protein
MERSATPASGERQKRVGLCWLPDPAPVDLARVVQHAVTRAGWTLVKRPDQARERAPEWPSALFSIIRAQTRAVLVIVHGSANHPAQRHPWLERSEPMLRGIPFLCLLGQATPSRSA